MRPVDLPSGAQRNVNAGMLWVEVHNGAGPFTTELLVQQTFRVSADNNNVVVTIDGVTAMTLRPNEVEYFNVGSGFSQNNKRKVTVTVTGASRVQVSPVSDDIYRYKP